VQEMGTVPAAGTVPFRGVRRGPRLCAYPEIRSRPGFSPVAYAREQGVRVWADGVLLDERRA
jgi:hypothetical protein